MPNRNFIVVDASGTILRSGSASEKMISLQAQEGETVIKTTRRVDDTVEYYDFETEEIKEIPGKRAQLQKEKLEAEKAQIKYRQGTERMVKALENIKNGTSKDLPETQLQQLAAAILQDVNFFKE
jgi:tRNA U34 5-carboxymethylaminomethyl modifying enzyme MnmG/GidA